MYKQAKKPITAKFRAVIGVFSVLGLAAVSLSVLVLSQQATNQTTNLESQAYSGWDTRTSARVVIDKSGSQNRVLEVPGAGSGQKPDSVYDPGYGYVNSQPVQNQAVRPNGMTTSLGDSAGTVTQTQTTTQTTTTAPDTSENQAARPNGMTTSLGDAGTPVAQTQTTTQTTTTAPSTAQTTNSDKPSNGSSSTGGSSDSKPSSSSGGGGSNTAGGGGSNNQQVDQEYEDAQATENAMACREYVLTQFYIRGGQAWTRGVPIDANGKEQWNRAEEFRMVVDLRANKNALPGDGKIQGYTAYVNPATGYFYQALARDNRFYLKSFPTYKGKINWVTEAQQSWKDMSFGQTQNVPMGGNVRGYNVLYTWVKNGNEWITRKQESMARGDKTYLNNKTAFTFRDGKRVSYTAGSFTQVSDLATQPSALPGSGEIEGMSDYVDSTGTILHQSWYRGNIGYIRDVPIENGVPNFGKATAAIPVVDLNKNPGALKGSGDFEAVANYVSCASN